MNKAELKAGVYELLCHRKSAKFVKDYELITNYLLRIYEIQIKYHKPEVETTEMEIKESIGKVTARSRREFPASFPL
jgi:hypothetical protein